MPYDVSIRDPLPENEATLLYDYVEEVAVRGMLSVRQCQDPQTGSLPNCIDRSFALVVSTCSGTLYESKNAPYGPERHIFSENNGTLNE